MRSKLDAVLQAVNEVILGKEPQVRLALACLLARGHLLIEDLPGMGKTTLSHALARVLGREPTEQISRTHMQALISPMRWSFMRESRRLRNAKLKSAGFVLRHPSALAFLRTNAEAIRAFAAQNGGRYEA